MFTKTCKRVLSLVLAFVMVMSLMPANVLAETLHDLSSDHEHPQTQNNGTTQKPNNEGTANKNPIQFGNPAWDALVEMNALLVRYFGNSEVSDLEIERIANEMTDAQRKSVAKDLEELCKQIEAQDFTERTSLLQSDSALKLKALAKLLDLVYLDSVLCYDNRQASQTNVVDIINGEKLTVNQNVENISSLMVQDITISLEIFQDSVDMLNEPIFSEETETEVVDGLGITFTDSLGNASLVNGGFRVTAKSSLSKPETNTVTIYNRLSYDVRLKFDYAASGYGVFSMPNSYGTYDDILASGDKITITIQGKNILSYGNNGASMVVNNFSVEEICKPNFLVGCRYFQTLSDAVAYAEQNDESTIILANDYTLPAGDYIIPAGITLLIPFDSNNSLYTTTPDDAGMTECMPYQMVYYEVPYPFRTLTLSSGANIVVDGAISLSAQHAIVQDGNVFGGAPCGPVSFLVMQEDSSIIVNNGGSLYVWGYITGKGTIVAKNGANVYEIVEEEE